MLPRTPGLNTILLLRLNFKFTKYKYQVLNQTITQFFQSYTIIQKKIQTLKIFFSHVFFIIIILLPDIVENITGHIEDAEVLGPVQ